MTLVSLILLNDTFLTQSNGRSRNLFGWRLRTRYCSRRKAHLGTLEKYFERCAKMRIEYMRLRNRRYREEGLIAWEANEVLVESEALREIEAGRLRNPISTETGPKITDVIRFQASNREEGDGLNFLHQSCWHGFSFWSHPTNVSGAGKKWDEIWRLHVSVSMVKVKLHL